MTPPVYLTHGLARLALHPLRVGDGPPALVLHGLAEHARCALSAEVAASWTGPVWALDFLGHGASGRPAGGGYTAEQLMGDADAALAHIGAATVIGRGLGAYVALLLAGARPELVRGAVLCDGPGLGGGGPSPISPSIATPAVVPSDGATDNPAMPDPFAIVELARDIRPPDYAATFARQATSLSSMATPLCVPAKGRPDWLVAVIDQPGVYVCDLAEALSLYGTAIV